MAVRWRQDSGVYRKYLQNIVVLYQSRQDIQIFTEVLLSLGTIIIFGLFAIKPTLVTIAELITEQKAKNETIAIMDQKINNLVEAQTLFESETNRLATLETAIPSRPETERYIRAIEGIAQKNSVTLTGLIIDSVPLSSNQESESLPLGEDALTPDTVPTFVSSITVSGPYPNLVGFLIDLESMRRPLFTESVQMAIVEGGQTVEINIVAKGKVPYLE